MPNEGIKAPGVTNRGFYIGVNLKFDLINLRYKIETVDKGNWLFYLEWRIRADFS